MLAKSSRSGAARPRSGRRRVRRRRPPVRRAGRGEQPCRSPRSSWCTAPGPTAPAGTRSRPPAARASPSSPRPTCCGARHRRRLHRVVRRAAHQRPRRPGRPLLRRLRHHQRRVRWRHVQALVYVDAFVPDDGETVFQILGGSGSALDVPDPTDGVRPGRLPRRPRRRRRGLPQGGHRARLLRPGPARGRSLADRREPATDHLERQHHPVRCARGSRCPAGPSWAPRTASSRRPRSARWPNAPARRSPRSRARTCRWCPTRRWTIDAILAAATAAVGLTSSASPPRLRPS